MLLFIVLLGSDIAHKFTIIHTNDIHGWIDAHPHIPELNLDLGDFHNFVAHMKEKVNEGESVFYFDSGDVTQGTGLSDAIYPYGMIIYEMMAEMPLDAMTIGNHDIYGNECIDNIADNVYPVFGGRLISSNVHYYKQDKKLADSYKVINVPKFGNIVVFGFLYADTINANHSAVIPIAKAINESWFNEALSTEDIQMIVVIGHNDVSNAESDSFVKALQAVKPDVPLIFLGGHTHKEQHTYAESVVRIQSLAYFKLFGLVQFDVTPLDSSTSSSVSSSAPSLSSVVSEKALTAVFSSASSVLVANLNTIANLKISFYNTTLANVKSLVNISDADWALPKGTAIKKSIAAYRLELGLDTVIGCTDVMYTSGAQGEHNMFELYVDHVLPDQKPIDNGNRIGPDGKMKGTVYIVGNGGTFRSNIYEGVIVYDDLLSVQPWKEPYDAIRDVRVDDVRIFYSTSPTPTSTTTQSEMMEKKKVERRMGNELVGHYYVSTVDNLDDYTYYDIGANSYDIDNIIKTLLRHNPDASYVREDLSNSDLDLLVAYVSKYMKCPPGEDNNSNTSSSLVDGKTETMLSTDKPSKSVAVGVACACAVVAVTVIITVVTCVAVREVRRKRRLHGYGKKEEIGEIELQKGMEEEEHPQGIKEES